VDFYTFFVRVFDPVIKFNLSLWYKSTELINRKFIQVFKLTLKSKKKLYMETITYLQVANNVKFCTFLKNCRFAAYFQNIIPY